MRADDIMNGYYGILAYTPEYIVALLTELLSQVIKYSSAGSAVHFSVTSPCSNTAVEARSAQQVVFSTVLSSYSSDLDVWRGC